MRKVCLLFVTVLVVASGPQAWAQRGQGRGAGGGMGGGQFGLLSQSSVQAELKLSDEQIKKVTEKAQAQRESLGGLQDLSQQERRAKMQELTKANDAAIAEILKPDQAARLKQISLQQRGAQAFADPEVASALSLTADQKEKIQTIQESAQSEIRDLFQAGGGAEAQQKIAALRQANNEKVLALLTPDQQASWKKLTGEPFKGQITRPNFRGGNARRGNAQRRNRGNNASTASGALRVES